MFMKRYTALSVTREIIKRLMFQITKLWSSLLNSNYTMKTLFLPRCLLDILSNSYLKIIYLAKSTDNFIRKELSKFSKYLEEEGYLTL